MNQDYLTTQYLNRVYDDLAKEHYSLMIKMKEGGGKGNEDTFKKNEDKYFKQINIFTRIMNDIVKLRNIRNETALKEVA
jgi:hypothetical protein